MSRKRIRGKDKLSFCKECVKTNDCRLQFDKEHRRECPLMDLAERRGFLRGDQFTGGNRTGTVQRTTVCAVEVWAECFGKDPSAIKRSDTYDIFGMLMKIGGWEKYSGNKNASLKRSFYGIQRCFVRKD